MRKKERHKQDRSRSIDAPALAVVFKVMEKSCLVRLFLWK